jgi:Flp pilus assembly protein TadD
MAAICEERGDPDGALLAARRAAYISPDSVEAHFQIGCILFRLGREEPARRSMRTALTLSAALDARHELYFSQITVEGLRRTAIAYLNQGQDEARHG